MTRETIKKHREYRIRATLFFVPQHPQSTLDHLYESLDGLFAQQPNIIMTDYGFPFTYRCFMNQLRPSDMISQYSEVVIVPIQGFLLKA